MSDEQEDIDVRKLKALFKLSDIKPPLDLSIMCFTNDDYETVQKFIEKRNELKKIEDLSLEYPLILHVKDNYFSQKEMLKTINFLRENLPFNKYPKLRILWSTLNTEIFEVKGTLYTEIFTSKKYNLVFCHRKKHFIKVKRNVFDTELVRNYCEDHFDETNEYSHIGSFDDLFQILNEHILNV